MNIFKNNRFAPKEPLDARRIALVSEKGGVAKTSTAASIALSLYDRGYNVRAYDLDSNRSLTERFRMREELDGSCPITQSMEASSNIRNSRIKRAIKEEMEVREDDFLIIDTGGQKSMSTIEVVTAPELDLVIIPTTSSYDDLHVTYETMKALEESLFAYNERTQVALYQVKVATNAKTSMRNDFLEHVELWAEQDPEFGDKYFVLNSFSTQRKSYTELSRVGCSIEGYTNDRGQKDEVAIRELHELIYEISGIK
mgnify:CR=1 FL=1